tara:strand:- start:150 stop:1004 length:855 start_codon:yes stop_codon:yes gene_type:complete
MNSKIKNQKELENILIESKHFFCISHFDGELDWINTLSKSKYLVYNKSKAKLDNKINNIRIKNVGYNIYSYLKFIIENYENLPDTVVFCKDNIFKRHIKISTFISLLRRNIFTCLEENNKRRNFPISINLSDNSFNEINSSWYKYEYSRKYFHDFNDFYKYIFNSINIPLFLRYAPGANYIVPKNNILLRSKIFYKNLLKFVSHSQYSCESHFIERSLYLIWNSNLESSENMNKIISKNELEIMNKKCIKIKDKESRILEKTSQKIIFFIGNIYENLLSKNLKR